MDFEGTEKKFELWIRPGSDDFRQWGESYWREVAAAAKAQILSRCSNDLCDAYLLSESSLFVYARRVLMITCGTTDLPQAAHKVLERVAPEDRDLFIYERKNEVFPHEQPSSFHQDASMLNAVIPGRAFQFGEQDEHHLFVYHLERPPIHLPERDVTVELLMYGLDPRICREFCSATATPGSVIEKLGLEPALSGYDLDEHFFEPSGYSMNAIRADRYATMHVTPEDRSSYASYETNETREGEVQAAVMPILEALRPRAFDWIVWERGERVSLGHVDYPKLTEVRRELSCGYRVCFANFCRDRSRVQQAVEIPLDRPGMVES